MHLNTAAQTILVVTDESDTGIFLCNLLNPAGLGPIVTCDMPEGLEIAKTKKPALIILDVMMADKKGIQMYYRLKQDTVLKDIPVIMLSGIDREMFYLYEKFQSSRKRAGIPEPDAYLEKPPEAEDLIRLVRGLMSAGGGEQRGVPVTDASKISGGEA